MSPDPSEPAPAGPGVRTAILVYLGLTVAVLVDVVLAPRGVVLSHESTDLFIQFVHWRSFGFGELAGGNLALWNPHLFCGAPYHGGFQSALLYPPNLLYLVFPLATAINLGIALHLFLTGLFTYLWARRRGLHGTAALFSGAVFMLCAPHVMHVFAGHLANLCTMAWVPLLFLAIDGVFDRPRIRWGVLGAVVVAMMVLAGHPQYVVFTAVGAALYSGLRLVRAPARGRTVALLAAMCLGGAALSAAQIVPALAAHAETVRARGLVWSTASMFHFPPENLLTAVAPDVFGNHRSDAYWGRWAQWETCMFAGVTTLVLAAYGLVAGSRRARRFAGVMMLACLVLALGKATPLHRLLYDHVPAFDGFRSISKFVFLVVLFLAIAAGAGLDRLLRGASFPRRGVIAAAALSALVLGAGLVVQGAVADGEPARWWHDLVLRIHATGDTYLPAESVAKPAFAARAGRTAATALLLAGITGLLAAGILGASRRRRWLLLGAPALAVLELIVFAEAQMVTTPIERARKRDLERAMRGSPPEARMLNPHLTDVAMSMRVHDLWGVDPGVPTRTAELMAFTQGQDPDLVNQYVSFQRIHPLFAMLRLRVCAADGQWRVLPGGIPRVMLVPEARIVAGRDEAFAVMSGPDFDPREVVVLESRPDPAPVRGGPPGHVTVVDESTDHLTIEAEVLDPAVLVITDSYAESWRARALPGSAQEQYAVMPANHALRAVPLGRGRHRIRLEYVPAGWTASRWVSGTALVALLVLCGLGCRRSRSRRGGPGSGATSTPSAPRSGAGG